MRILAFVLGMLSLVAPAAHATGESGLRGVVMRGPTSPVCRDDEPCEAPAANVALVFKREGRIVARTTSGQKGGYRIALKPGRYLVTTARRTIGAGLTPRTVVVPRERFARVDLHLDTGIQ
ncbi:MAG: carboxypeptidase-like regulatory domain-containing protein [Gaiellaceae bacterium MAG52_C11]|nr:carboxypeptidase-like regulatory domain-containing protein [Candidatus Gaiellasilicea maunaloa]